MMEFPVDMFLPGSDLTPVRENIDKIVEGLTKWQPKVTQQGVIAPPMVEVQGKDYPEALANMQRLFQQNLWSDGLPFDAPTKETVDWLLTGTDLKSDDVVGKIGPRGGIATVQTIAVNLAMAGGRPEYMPVLIAAVQAMLDPAQNHEQWQATTCNVYPAVVVDGPIAKQIRLNSSYGALGPDPVHPAGGSIGRALRSLQMNVGGALPGTGTMAIQGGPFRYANVVFAEDVDNLPDGWDSLSVELGHQPGANVVTLYHVSGAVNMPGGEASTEEIATISLNVAASYMSSPNGNGYGVDDAGFLVMSAKTIQNLVNLGWTKDKVKEYLWENSKVPVATLSKISSTENLAWWLPPTATEPVPIASSAEGIRIVAAGGDQGGHMMWLQAGMGGSSVTSAEIQLPAGWDNLLKQAEQDLGPLPAR
jgi:hypothetical protein